MITSFIILILFAIGMFPGANSYIAGTHTRYLHCPYPAETTNSYSKEFYVSIAKESDLKICKQANSCYLPEILLVNCYSKVIWRNDDDNIHLISSGSQDQGPDGWFASTILEPGERFSFVFERPGIYRYFDPLHSWAQGAIIVKSGNNDTDSEWLKFVKGSNSVIGRNQSAVIIQPIFTQAAYGKHGFYDYYERKCDKTCLTVPIPTGFSGSYETSREANDLLLGLHYDHVTDIDIDKNPRMLQKYDKVILLHNEYVTSREFEAIANHHHVIYLYPNALFAEVKTDYQKNTLTLVRGHWFPDKKIANGFGWKFDNTKFEDDTTCNNWYFYKIDNGKMLNCYPEYIIRYNMPLLQAIESS